MLEGSWSGHYDAHYPSDDCKDDSTHRMIRKRVEDLGASENMEANQEDIICQQHKGCEMICNHALAKDIVSKVTDIHDLWMSHDILVHRD